MALRRAANAFGRLVRRFIAASDERYHAGTAEPYVAEFPTMHLRWNQRDVELRRDPLSLRHQRRFLSALLIRSATRGQSAWMSQRALLRIASTNAEAVIRRLISDGEAPSSRRQLCCSARLEGNPAASAAASTDWSLRRSSSRARNNRAHRTRTAAPVNPFVRRCRSRVRREVPLIRATCETDETSRVQTTNRITATEALGGSRCI
jgi:hypothetical protein